MKERRYFDEIEIEYIKNEDKVARYFEEIEYIREQKTAMRIIVLAMIAAVMLLIALII